MKTVTKSNEDYLEAIMLLCRENGSAKVTQLAKQLGVSKPAVTTAMNELSERELIYKESYGDITLTEKGLTMATAIYEKHNLIKRVLIGIGVCAETAEVECCKIEHILSDETLSCLKSICKKYGY